MNTMKTDLQNFRKSLCNYSEDDFVRATDFVTITLDELYSKQIDAYHDFYGVALEYDENLESYQVLTWDWKLENFVSNGESTIPKRLLDLIFTAAASQEIIPISEKELKEKNILPLRDEPEDKKKRKNKKEKERWILLLDLREPEVEENQNPQQMTG
ncbi:MAG: hypothetical protein K2H53_02245 [Clostridia bacterium]|nr:hypothetical protein [Clostridia bacterium]